MPPIRPALIGLSLRDGYLKGPNDRGAGLWITGGLTLMTNCTLVNNALIQRCVMVDNASGTYWGEIYLDNGFLNMTNNVCARTVFGSGMRVFGGIAEVVNTTFADNARWGLETVSGMTTIRNCLGWGNAVGGFSNCTAVSYTDSQEPLPGVVFTFF